MKIEQKQNVIRFRTVPLASFHESRIGTIKMEYRQEKKVMMTVNTDRTIKVYREFNYLPTKYRFFLLLDLGYGICGISNRMNDIFFP